MRLRRGRIRVSVDIDERFDRTCADWADELRDEVAANLEDGTYEVFETAVEVMHCGAAVCPHHRMLGSLCGTVIGGRWQGSYSLLEFLGRTGQEGHEHMHEIVRDIIAAAEPLQLQLLDRFALGMARPRRR